MAQAATAPKKVGYRWHYHTWNRNTDSETFRTRNEAIRAMRQAHPNAEKRRDEPNYSVGVYGVAWITSVWDDGEEFSA